MNSTSSLLSLANPITYIELSFFRLIVKLIGDYSKNDSFAQLFHLLLWYLEYREILKHGKFKFENQSTPFVVTSLENFESFMKATILFL